MFGELVDFYIRLTGGFWAYRTRFKKCRFKFLKRLYRFFYFVYQRNYGSFIGYSAEFASEPCLPHSLNSIFIGGGARIGKNCVIFQQVTIGASPMPFSKKTGQPTIGDNCYIGAGAMVIGSVIIGNNCRIGANCVVTKDVPDNTIVVAAEPRVIHKDKPLLNRYYRYSKDGPIYFDEGKWILETDQAIVRSLNGQL